LKRITSRRKTGKKVQEAAADFRVGLFCGLDKCDARILRVIRGYSRPHQWLLGLEYEAGMTILVALFPNGRDLVNGDVANVFVIVFQMKDATLDFDNLAAETRRAGAKHIDFVIDHF